MFASGVVLAVLGGYHFLQTFLVLSDGFKPALMAASILKTIIFFLVAIVFFVFALGILVLFTNKPERDFPINFPKWLQVKNFMQLKVILWEAILTTLVIWFLTSLVQKALDAQPITVIDGLIPVSIFLMAVSLFLLKKGEH